MILFLDLSLYFDPTRALSLRRGSTFYIVRLYIDWLSYFWLIQLI